MVRRSRVPHSSFTAHAGSGLWSYNIFFYLQNLLTPKTKYRTNCQRKAVFWNLICPSFMQIWQEQLQKASKEKLGEHLERSPEQGPLSWQLVVTIAVDGSAVGWVLYMALLSATWNFCSNANACQRAVNRTSLRSHCGWAWHGMWENGQIALGLASPLFPRAGHSRRSYCPLSCRYTLKERTSRDESMGQFLSPEGLVE